MSNIYVNFLPWLTLYKSVSFGKIIFWNYHREAEKRISDLQVRERLERHFDSYRSINDSRFPITICSYEGKGFHENLNKQEFNHLRETITALAFASAIEDIEKRIQTKQNHKVPPSMNSFELIPRELNLNSNNYAHISPSVFDLGLQDGNITFQKPFGARGEAHTSRKWIKHLNAYLALKTSNRLRNRISRSLEFFRLALAQDDLKDNAQETAFLTRTVLLITALESLLNFPTVGKADFFADYLNQRFSLKNSRKSSRKLRKNKPKFQYSLVAWWAYDFYKLRNGIVHGNKVNSEKLSLLKKGFWFSQMDIASIVFADCLEEIIRERKLIKGNKIRIGKLLIDDLEIDDIFELRGQKNWEKHHKVLGWIK